MGNVPKTIYPATPSSLKELKEEIKADMRRAGYIVPFHPADVCPYDEFERNPDFGRERTLKLLRDFQRYFDVLGICGISEGVMQELEQAVNTGQELVTFPKYDPDWDKKYEALKGEFGDPFKRLRIGRGRLIVIVGTRAVGKTYWIGELLKPGLFDRRIMRVKTTTTRASRVTPDMQDFDSYNFMSVADFTRKEADGLFLETDTYNGNRYGSSITAIREGVAGSDGILALTPAGIPALWKYRYEFDISIIFLRPASPHVMLENMKTRGDIKGPLEQENVLKQAETFAMPAGYPYKTVFITRNPVEKDRAALLEAVRQYN